MKKFLILLLIVASCLAEPPRSRQRQRLLARQPLRRPQRLRLRPQFARQQAVAPTPYPSASELKPEVPFEPESQPELVYGPPDQTYGPPDQVYGPPEEQLPSAEAAPEFAPNPDAEEFAASPLQNAPRLPQTPLQLQPQVQLQRQHLLPQRVLVPQAQKLALAAAPVQVAPVPVAATLPVTAQQYYFVNQPFAYTAQVQAW